MTVKKKKGDYGEGKACLHLIEKGYNIVAQNFRSRSGEIDIIAENNERLAFVEVKTRSLCGVGRPCDAVDYKKKQRIIKTAKYYLLYNTTDKQVGFDIIEVVITDSLNPEAIEINHFEDAFDASGGLQGFWMV